MTGFVIQLFRFATLALGASIGWFVGFLASFIPMQGILADPARQSAKFLSIFTTLEPLPRISSGGGFALLVLIVGGFLAAGYVLSRPDRGAPWWRRGLRFGLLAWVIMVPWFELYLPWNVLHEPLPLVLLEGACWWITLSCSGVAMAVVDRRAKS